MAKQYQIKWREDDVRELNRVVKNFNAKISRLEKSQPEIAAFLPERVSAKELKGLINSRADLNRELNSLKRFSKRGGKQEEIVTVPGTDYDLKLTRWQKNEMARRVGTINRRRANRLEKLQNLEAKSQGESLGYKVGDVGMGRVRDQALQPMNAFTRTMTQTGAKKKWRSIVKESQLDYFNKSDEIYRNNFIQQLERNFEPEHVEQLIKDLKAMDIERFLLLAESEDAINIFELAYPLNKDDSRKKANRLKSIFTPEGK